MMRGEAGYGALPFWVSRLLAAPHALCLKVSGCHELYKYMF